MNLVLWKPLVAVGVFVALAFGWRYGFVPAWILALSLGTLLIWGLNLDWKRKGRDAERKTRTKDRQHRDD